jgi:hypothetical protein
MTIVEIRPDRWSWKVFAFPGIEAVLPDARQAISYATERVEFFRPAEIRVMNSGGQVEQIVVQAGGKGQRPFGLMTRRD